MVDPEGYVDGYTWDETENKLVVSGNFTVINVNFTELVNVTFAGVACAVDQSLLTNDSLTCTLEKQKVCGTWHPTINHRLGKIPVDESVLNTTIECPITAVTPSTNLKLVGNENVTFTGENLPHDLFWHEVSIVFNDINETECIPNEISSTHIQCEIERWDLVISEG
jgi:hypothetical protein